MINAQLQGITQPQTLSTPVARLSPRLFWWMFACIGLLAGAALLVLVAAATPDRTPLARSADIVTVREQVWSNLNGAVNDPLVELTPGVTARQSNIRGFALNGQVYYYYVEGRQNFDPLSRGRLRQDQVELLMRDDAGPQTLVIYRPLQP